jgi:flagellar hook-length control protein FliK
MLDKPDTIDQSAPKDQGSLDQAAPAQASSKPATESAEPVPAANAKITISPEATTAQAQPADTDAAAEKPATEQEIADFLAAVVAATGMKITPVAQSKGDEKPTETKSEDQSDDAPVVPDAAAPAEIKSADAAAIVVTVQADATVTAPEETVAKSAGIAAMTTEQTKAAPTAETVVPGETKDTKPQTTAKTDTPALTPNLAPDAAALETDKPAATPQAANSGAQPAAPQAAKPEALAQAAKPAPVHHDAPDVAASTKPADNVQSMLLTQTHTAPAADQPVLTAAPANTPQAVALPVAGIAVEIAARAFEGKNRFEIRLDPPELGKIHVRLDVDHKGEVTSIITADRSDTFDLLRRDSQALERALQDAGVKTSSNGLQFSLRDHTAGRHDQPALADSARVIVRDDNLDTEIIAPVYRSFSGNRAGVDIRV